MNQDRSSVTPKPSVRGPSSRPGNPIVIRPMQPLPGTEQAIRVDGPTSLEGPHPRSEKLEEYVRWLQQQSHNQLNSKSAEPPKPEPMLRESPVNRTRQSVDPTPLARSTNAKDLSDNASFDRTSRDPSPVEPFRAPTSKPIIQFVTKPESPRNFRMDQPHVDAQSRFNPAPKRPPLANQLEADLERILQKLETADIKPNDLVQLSGPASASHSYDATQFSKPPVTAMEGRRKIQPAEFAQPYPENPVESAYSSAAAHPLEGLTKSEIIQTISSAIISVLTNQAEPLIDAKVKQHLKELHLELVAENEPAFESTLNEPETIYPYSSPAEEFAGVTSGSSNADRRSREIPVQTAAWDVSEFRWPMISDQMIKVGADAIQALSSTVLTTLAGTRRRVAVTSPSRRAGTTSLTISLARWVANQGGRVLVVDADLLHPELSSLVGLGPGISWLSLLSRRDQTPVHGSEYIIRSQQSPICVMPLFPGHERVRTKEKIYDQLGKMIDPLTFDFDLILLDMGPVSQIVAELSSGQLLLDTALMVHQEKDFSVTQAQNQLRALDVEQFVFAQNSVQPARSSVA